MQVKEALNNLIFTIGFQMSKIECFQMALNTAKCDSMALKIAFFFKKLQKIVKRLGASPPDPRL